MARLYPQPSSSSSSSSSSSCYITSGRESFTLWMKSLVFHGNGCTVFDSDGKLVYRIDNYGQKYSREVDLMDVGGNVLFSIRQKKMPVFGHWDGYRRSDAEVNKRTPSFQVRKLRNVLKGGMRTYVVSGTETSSYQIRGLPDKSAFKITDTNGKAVAEVKQKQSSSGVNFGEDVLSLVVEPQVDHSLVMALVIVYELINHKL
ncbi:protein LURP-one-related 11 [Coffea arabica]|uniref:Protein LURP-one-related 11 n=1 Tax=Coffea arabica TaxID=13443 RepID=A0A6P6U275_COFAR|nr:protein LURP-one-related 11-like isoform X1 [Coffea arabica]